MSPNDVSTVNVTYSDEFNLQNAHPQRKEKENHVLTQFGRRSQFLEILRKMV